MTTFTVTADIPVKILRELQNLDFKTEVTFDHALRLIATILYELDSDETHHPDDFYKELSKKYIIAVTSDPFRKDTFSKKLQGQINKSNFQDKLLQTDGRYCVKYYPKHYRINPKFLEGPTQEVLVELTFETYNDEFPELIQHFNDSVALIKPKLSPTELISEVRSHAAQMNITSTGAFSAFYTKSVSEFLDFDSKKYKITEPIFLKGYEKKKYTLEEIESIIKSDMDKEGKAKLMLIQSKNKKSKIVSELVNYEDFLNTKGNHLVRRVTKAITNISNNEWRPMISKSNGRFNHQFTYVDKFCIDHYEFGGEEICSYDLKASQPTILANLLCKNPKLLNSIANSKYKRLKEYFDLNQSYFFNIESKEWLEELTNTDIYSIIAKEKGITRNQAKKEIMVLFFTEPEAHSPISIAMSNNFPTFYYGLRDVQASFKKTLKSSKKTLPVFLQFVEAHVFLELIYSELAKANIPAITKHDSILFPKSRKEAVKAIIDGCFKALDFKSNIVFEEPKILSVEDQISKHFKSFYFR